MNDKMISVIMGIYNCEDTLEEALDSIVRQTYTNWELIMCDDGSRDNTYEVAKKYVDFHPQYRMKILRHEKNQGLNQTLNDCLKVATGAFIARMDGDDISLPERFEKEMREFEKEPELSVVSCPMIYFDENGVWATGKCNTEYPMKKDLVYGTVHAHAPCIIRQEAIRSVGGYSVDKKLLRVEDWHLWVKVYSSGYYGKNLDEPLYMMRDDENATKRRRFRYRLNEAYVSREAVKQFGLPCKYYLFSLWPIIVGLLPVFLYNLLHRKKVNKQKYNGKQNI